MMINFAASAANSGKSPKLELLELFIRLMHVCVCVHDPMQEANGVYKYIYMCLSTEAMRGNLKAAARF